MTVGDLGDHLKDHWSEIGSGLLDGTYTPQPVRRVEIPKASGGVRLLGVPTVLDRFIQQAVMQVLQGDWDPSFSDASYGFRPGRSAHQAVERAQDHIRAGFGVAVDLDLEKFFDRVNHDILMGLVAKRVADKRLLRLIRGFLTAGVLDGGLVGPTTKGTPQGGPLSPLLSNLMLDVLDKELEERGHRFVRYADDCNIYVRSRRAGERAGHGERDTLPRPAAQADGERRQERGGPPGGAGLPGLQLHSRIGGQAAYRAAGARPAQGAGPGTDARHEERQPHPPRCGAVPLPRRVAGILRLLRDPLGTAQHRPMGQTAAPRHRLAAVEAWAYPLCGAAPPRRRQGPSGSNRREFLRPVADRQQSRALLRTAQRLLRPAWPRLSGEPCRRIKPSNRRGTDPYARWCGRGGAVRLPPIPITFSEGAGRASRESRARPAVFRFGVHSKRKASCMAALSVQVNENSSERHRKRKAADT